ncbi:MAG TPA: hypothetical protein VIH71_01555 [Solirubrobacteraceae bacterium]
MAGPAVSILAVYLIAVGTILSVGSFWSSLKEVVSERMQQIGLMIAGVGTMLGFGSVLEAAGEKGLFWPIVGGLCVVCIITAVIVYFGRASR